MPLIVCESLIQSTTPWMNVAGAERDDQRVDAEADDEAPLTNPTDERRRRARRRSTAPIDQPWLTFRIASIIAESVSVAATERS